MDGCQKCGAREALQYAHDGRGYCASCICSQVCPGCSQSVPAALMRPFEGRILCVSCVQAAEKKQDLALQALSYPESCGRCGAAVSGLVHVWNGKPLCGGCLEDMKASWEIVGKKPGKGGSKVRAVRKKKKAKRKRIRKKMKVLAANPFRKVRPLVERRPMGLPRYLR